MQSKDARKQAIEEAQKNSRLAFDLTQQGLNDLLKQRKEIDKEITQHQKDLVRLAPLCGIEAKSPLSLMGLTDAIRFLIADGFAVTNDEIRDQLIDAKFRLPESNPQAAIQTALRRLMENGEIVDFNDDDPEKPAAWMWRSDDNPPPLPIPDWMVKSQEQIQKEKQEKEAREKERAKKAAEAGKNAAITDEDVPF